MITKFIQQFTKKKVVEERTLLIQNDKYFLVDKKGKEIIQQVRQNTGNDPYLMGLYLGRQKGYTFFPSLSLLELIFPYGDNIVTVNDDVAFLFICGRDVFGKGILSINGKCAENTIVLVQNKDKELLGFGKRVHPITSKKEVVTNLFDVGDFLRREKNRD